MTIIKGVFDGKSIRLLEPIKLDKPHWVNVVIGEAVEDRQSKKEQRQRILNYAGILSDLTDTQWNALSETLEQRNYFPERTISW